VLPVPGLWEAIQVISIDTETTGVDLRHGAKPFFFTSCNEAGEVTFFEWDVVPETREPIIPQEDIELVLSIIHCGEELVLQNAKFDVAALASIIPDLQWPWERTHDTLVSGHLLASNLPHNLTDMVSQYLGVDIELLEKDLEFKRLGLAIIDETGRYIGEEYSLALCLDHVLREHKGPVVTNCATSRMA
jgi:hypothetical protein